MQTYVGNLTREASVRKLEGDNLVVNFRVALNRRVKKDGEWVERTTYLQCSLFNKPGLVQYLTKGRLVEVTGHTEAEAYQGEDGKIHASLKLVVRSFSFPNSPSRDKSGGTVETSIPPISEQGGEVADDLPF
jgi:single-strand DNA-binding protein